MKEEMDLHHLHAPAFAIKGPYDKATRNFGLLYFKLVNAINKNFRIGNFGRQTPGSAGN